MSAKNSIAKLPRKRSSERWTKHFAEIECARRSWECEPVSWYDGRFKRNHDLFGFVDMIATPMRQLRGPPPPAPVIPITIAIQYCALGDVSTRVKKIEGHVNAAFVRAMAWHVLVWGFSPEGRLREVVVFQ